LGSNVKHSLQFKLIIAGAGKTTLLHHYMDEMPYHPYPMTIGIDFKSKQLFDDYVMMMWDTAGQQRYEKHVLVFFKIQI
jgi:GTPase SAR1 family protein